MRELHHGSAADFGDGGCSVVFGYVRHFTVVGYNVDGGRLVKPMVARDPTVAVPSVASWSLNVEDTKATHPRLLDDKRNTLAEVTSKRNVSYIRDTKPVGQVRKVISYGIALEMIQPLAANDVAARTYSIELTRAEACQPAFAVAAIVETEIRSYRWDGIPGYLPCKQSAAATAVKGGMVRDDAAQVIALMRV